LEEKGVHGYLAMPHCHTVQKLLHGMADMILWRTPRLSPYGKRGDIA
jgi:hypothetical protein